ncbi:MAG: sodium:alanine symporter family protein [Clostridia bacterium]|nr:sodium:alanine symporter family protein [Clostridia bacterium]
MTQFLETLAGLLWGPGMLALVFGTGIYLTIGTRWLSLTKLKSAFSAALKGQPDAQGEVSGFGALCTSLAATLGTGNIIGVATAVAAGGPGALFWMIVAAFFGMATKYAEGYLAVQYRRRSKDGFLGGPFLYLEQGMKKPFLAKIFAVSCVLCCLLSMGTTSQINGMVMAVTDFFDPNRNSASFDWGSLSINAPALIAGALTTLLVGLVLAGGIRRIASVSTLLVPFMAGLYTLLILWLLLQNVSKIPGATLLILKSAVAPKAVFGGAAGFTVQKALRYGLGRGIFSNEAGMGSDPIAAAAAQTDSPARQGLISMLGPFLDTVVMCTLTGYAVIVTDAWRTPGLSGAGITLYALRQLPLPDGLLSFLYMLCLLFFGFSSIIGWSYYGEQSLRYLLPHTPKSKYLFRIAFLVFLMLGAFLSPDAVWALADILCALMAIPNLIGLIGLGDQVFKGTKRYFNEK